MAQVVEGSAQMLNNDALDEDEDDPDYTIFRRTLTAILENGYIEDEEEELDDSTDDDDEERFI